MERDVLEECGSLSIGTSIGAAGGKDRTHTQRLTKQGLAVLVTL